MKRLLLPILATVSMGADVPRPLPSVDAPLATGASNPADYAVVIGLEDYASLADVPYATRDALAFEQLALKTRGIPSARVVTLVGRQSRAQLRKALTDAGAATGAGGTVWVYFAGHGAANPTTRERMLLPTETPQDELGFADLGLAMSEVERLATAGGAQLMLVVDACYTGAGRGGGELLADGKRLAVPATARAPERGASWLAAAENQAAAPLRQAEHGVFTYAVLGALRGWADGATGTPPDGAVTSEEAATYVRGALLRLGITDQQPVWSGAAMTLVSGPHLEPAPELPRVLGTSAVPPPPAAAPTASPKVVVLGEGVSLDGFEQELVEAQCQSEALRQGPAQAQAALTAAAAAKATELATTWATIAAQRDACLGLATVELRAPCITRVEAFLTAVDAAAVERPAGREVVAVRLPTSSKGAPVDCGTREVPVAALRQPVQVPEADAARALLEALKRPPALIGAASASGASTSAAVAQGQPIVIGALDRALIDAVVKTKLSQIRYCYQRELATHAGLAGRLSVKFTIATDGTVSQAAATSDTLGNERATTCIVERFRHMVFPPPTGGGIVIVTYPFVFSPG